MVLSDRTIRKEIESNRIVIDPLGDNCIQPASVDVHLDSHLLLFRGSRQAYIDIRKDQSNLTEMFEIKDDEPFMLHPNEFVLGSTIELVELPDDIVARVEGKSSLGRLGLLVHATAGYVDPGWKGKLTMELSNVSNLPIKLYYNMKIGQLSFFELSTPAENPYGSSFIQSKYQNQEGPTASKGYTDYQ